QIERRFPKLTFPLNVSNPNLSRKENPMKNRIRQVVILSLALCSLSLGLAAAFADGWPQWMQNPQHTGFLNVVGQNLNKILANIVYDPLVPDEQAHNGGDLLVHYQTPLVEGNDVYMESKAGSYTVGTYATQTWHQNKFTWQGKNLVKVWTFDSDWVPPGGQADFWEPVYHAVLANGYLYDPGFGGSIFKVNKSNGAAITRLIPAQFLNPDGSLQSHTFTVSPLTADSAGNIYYNVLKIHDNGQFYDHDAIDSWLVKVTPTDAISVLSYTGLNPAAPSSGDACNDGTPASDGSMLPLNGATDTNGNLLGGCRAGARAGVDPATNRFGGGRVLDDESSTPTVAPDGSVFFGAYSRYNYAQGHLMRFAGANGAFLQSYSFGWDSTVA